MAFVTLCLFGTNIIIPADEDPVYTRFISFNQYEKIRNYEECYATFYGFRAAGYSRPAPPGDATLE
jgi:hypothetical protein